MLDMTNSAQATYLSAGDVAKRAGVSAQTVSQWERTGKLLAAERTEGGMRLFARADVERFLEERARC